MTIAIAWVRTIRDCEELVFVTDSRLSGDGCNFDACPKVITLPRNDCAIAFAGYTGHAFPMMQQLSHAISSHAPLQRGSLDLVALKSHALKIFDDMSHLIRSSDKLSSPADTTPDANFIFGGYSWIDKGFRIWAIRYNKKLECFEALPPKCVRRIDYDGRLRMSARLRGQGSRIAGNIVFAGDQADVAQRMLLEKLSAQPNLAALNMEPFEVVRDMLREPSRSETIGGPPQIVKVYQYLKSAPIGVHWPDKETGKVFLQGRPCLGYERTDRWIIDPDTLQSKQHLIVDRVDASAAGCDLGATANSKVDEVPVEDPHGAQTTSA